MDGKGGLSSVGVEGQILRDVHRTFSKFALFMDPDGAGQALLANVLKRLAHVDEIDYCQGMNFVVGVLLMVVTGCTELEAELDSTLVREVEAFRARHGDDAVFEQMIALLDAPRYRLRGMWSAGFPGLVLRSYQFTQICNAILPKLCAHMVVMDLSTTAFISQWFLTLFAYTLPTPLLLRIWDLFFISGWSAIIAVSVAILETNEAHLLACTFEEFLQFVGRNSLQVHYEDAARCERLLEAAAAIHRTCWASMAELEVKYRRDRLRAHVPSACDLPSTPIRTHIRKLSSTSTGALSSSIDSKHRALNNMLRSAKQQLGGGGGTSTVVRPKHTIVDGCTVKHITIIVPPSPKHKPSSLGAEAEGSAVASDVASNAKGKGFGDLPDLSALSQREVQLSREWAALNACVGGGGSTTALSLSPSPPLPLPPSPPDLVSLPISHFSPLTFSLLLSLSSLFLLLLLLPSPPLLSLSLSLSCSGLRYDVTVLQLKIEGAGTQIEELTRMLDAEIIELKKVEEAAQSCMTNKEQLVEVLQHLMFAGADASRHFDREKQVHLREEITKVQRYLLITYFLLHYLLLHSILPSLQLVLTYSVRTFN